MTHSQSNVNRRPGVALAVIALGQLMIVLDATVVNVALPTIHRALHFSTADLEWVVTSYALTFGGLLLFGGRTGDLFGKRRMFMIGIAVFALASLFGGLATDPAWLIIARGLQGVGGAIVSPTALSLVAINFPEGPTRTRALAVYSAISAAGGGVGLLLGGLLTSYVSWRWIFFVNVPIGAVGLVMSSRALVESPRIPGRLDTPGTLTATAGMVSLVYGLTNVGSRSWGAATTWVPLGAAAALLGAFLVIETRVPAPVMPLGFFRFRNRSGVYAVLLCLVPAVFSMFFFLTLYFQNIRGYTPVRSGLAFLPMVIGIVVASMTTAPLLRKVSVRVPLIVGPTCALVALVLISGLTTRSSYLDLVGPLVLLSLGMGQCFVPLTMTAMSSVEPHEAGLASALFNTIQQIGGALGLSVLGTIAASATKHYSHAHQGAVSPALTNAATVHGYAVGFRVGAVIAAGALAISLIVLRVPRNSPAAMGEAEEAAFSVG